MNGPLTAAAGPARRTDGSACGALAPPPVLSSVLLVVVLLLLVLLAVVLLSSVLLVSNAVGRFRGRPAAASLAVTGAWPRPAAAT